MTNVQKLTALIDETAERQDISCSEDLARFFDERGVGILPLPVEIGTPVWCVKAKIRRANGYMMHCIVINAEHYDWLRKNNAEFYIHQKPFARSDASKLNRVYFLSKEEAESKCRGQS